jgi:hypothetical protein
LLFIAEKPQLQISQQRTTACAIICERISDSGRRPSPSIGDRLFGAGLQQVKMLRAFAREDCAVKRASPRKMLGSVVGFVALELTSTKP